MNIKRNKLSKYLHIILPLAWLLFLSSPILGLVKRYLVNNGITIRGFSTIVNTYTFVMLGLFVVLLISYFKYRTIKTARYYRNVLIFIAISSLVTVIITTYLIHIENTTYPNYLFSHYGFTYNHIELMNSIVYGSLILCILLISSKKIHFKHFNSFANPSDLTRMAASIGIIIMIVMSLSTTLNFRRISKAELGGYEEKLGVHFIYIDNLAKYTGIKSVVIHPPQGDKWPAVGNQPILNYFLTPRILVSGALITNNEYINKFNEVYFTEIEPDSDNNWPEINIKERRISFNEKDWIDYKSIEIIKKLEEGNIYKAIF